MKPVISVYYESGDIKLAVLSKTKNGISLHQTLSAHVNKGEVEFAEVDDGVNDYSSGAGSDLSFEDVDFDSEDSSTLDNADISFIANSLGGFQLNKSEFIPVISEPGLNYHIFEGDITLDKKQLLDEIIKDISATKNISVSRDSIDYIKFNDKSLLCVFIDGPQQAVNFVDSLALFNNRRYYKIPTIKSADVAISNFVSRNMKFFPEDLTLIVYTEKEYSSLIFLEGDKLKHIGARLEIGTESSYSYDVYFSKILLEMEKGDIPRLDNVVLCGEDTSENFILSFYSTFPEADVNALKFDNIDTSKLDEESSQNLTSFVVPIAAAEDYFIEIDKKIEGINILPRYIHENQKAIQLGWHSYAIFPLLFAATFFFTYSVLSNYKQMSEIDSEIQRLTQIRAENQTIIDQIIPLEQKISTFEESQAILDNATEGTEVWSKAVSKISEFVASKRNFWITKIGKINDTQIRVEGFSRSRKALTEFAEFESPATLQSVFYEPLRDKKTFAFNLTFNLTKDWSN
ncbi:MAG: hypothetical protein HND52_04620 [Ignavibacteriae bacterium]|jgi:hypothetical protein|nr:hypothetical protein [Ignavibacteriota bacterium]NOG97242.1 hypothetical protein [Ignavibacteriota bacterium]